MFLQTYRRAATAKQPLFLIGNIAQHCGDRVDVLRARALGLRDHPTVMRQHRRAGLGQARAAAVLSTSGVRKAVFISSTSIQARL